MDPMRLDGSRKTGDRIADEFKSLIMTHAVAPIVSDEIRIKYSGCFVAFSFEDNLPRWQDKGAAKTRGDLAEQMSPLQVGEDYFVHSIE